MKKYKCIHCGWEGTKEPAVYHQQLHLEKYLNGEQIYKEC